MSIKVVSSTDSTEAVSAENAAVAHGTSEDKNESSNAEAHAEAEETESQDEDESARESEAGDDEESDTEEEESQDEKPKKRRGYQRRVDKLKSRLTDREREIEFWKQKALSATPPKQDEPVTQSQSSDGEPDPNDFETHAAYVKALTSWETKRLLAQEKEESRKREAKSESEKRTSSFRDKVKTFAETKDDFEDVIEAVDDIPMSVAVQEVILESDIGPELMYELAKDKDEYARICKLTPLAAARELGKIEARLSKSAETKQTSQASKPKAPPPLTPVGSKSSGSKKSFDPNWSQSEYERWREAQDAKRA